MTTIQVGADESIFDTAEVKALRVKGEALYEDLVQTKEAKALMERANTVITTLWEQAKTDLGIEGDIETFIASGQVAASTILIVTLP